MFLLLESRAAQERMRHMSIRLKVTPWAEKVIVLCSLLSSRYTQKFVEKIKGQYLCKENAMSDHLDKKHSILCVAHTCGYSS